MSNPIFPIAVGLGVLVSASSIVAVAGPPPASPAARSAQDNAMPAVFAPAEGSAAAPPTSDAFAPPEGDAGAPPPSRTVLLMKDGTVRVFDAPVVEDRADYVVRMGIGEFRVPGAQVEGRFGTLREAYDYQRDHLPDRDPDEHLRLARWCLSHGMEEEAAEQLRALLSWSPGDRTAEGMLRNLAAAASSRAARDAGVVRTGGDSAGGAGGFGLGPEPRELHDSVLGRMRAYKGPVAAPLIFDLPEALAVRRFQEYGNTVHRVLQLRCASCHDELSDRNFRLVRARDPKDMANQLLLRTNLDATLALIDRSNPAQSQLLISAVMPHGRDQRPIIPNPNSQEYRALWGWIESLRGESAPGASPTVMMTPAPMTAPAPGPMMAPMPGTMPRASGMAPPQGQAMPADPAFGGGFATQRSGPVATAPAPMPAPGPALTPYPHSSYQQIQMDASHPSAPADLDFQTVSPLLGSPEAAKLSVDGRPAYPPGSAMAPAQSMNWPGGGPPAQVAAPQVPDVPAPRAIPGPGVVLPPGAAPPAAFGAAVPVGAAPAPASAPAPAGVVSLPDGTQIITQADGSKVMRLPNGMMAPFMDRDSVDGQAGSKEFQIDPALLEKLQRGRMGGP